MTLCEGVKAAEAIRDRLQAMEGGSLAFGFGGNPQEPSAMRGGPRFELLFGIDTPVSYTHLDVDKRQALLGGLTVRAALRGEICRAA